MEICSSDLCTGCGMCVNLCPHGAIQMTADIRGFVHPEIDRDKCTECGLCASKCPAKREKVAECNMRKIYAAWNKQRKIRQGSTSGGVFSLIAENVLNDNGVVVGVRWNEKFCPEHVLVNSNEQLKAMRGSKYVQSNTGNIYSDVKKALDTGRRVLFSGTPCQLAALKAFLGKDFPNLLTVDLVCHGVPSNECFSRYLSEIKKEKTIQNIRMRYKSPCWDFSCVRIDFSDGTHYQKYTVDDPYFTLFNIGYTLRESCHSCKFTTTAREGDITLADFWGFLPKTAKMRNFNRGLSLVSVNTDSGEKMFDKIRSDLIYEEKTLTEALNTNKSFYEPYDLPKEKLDAFWSDYGSGTSFDDLCKKHVTSQLKIPNLLFLRRLKKKYSWVLKRK